jgi:DNA-directed RNA polymerase specialized sigma24 family protein
MSSVIDGEDVVQDNFVRASVALDELEESAPMRAWLFRIAHNRALDLLRSRALHPAEPLEAAQEVADPESFDKRRIQKRFEMPAVQTKSFIPTGTPARGPTSLPVRIAPDPELEAV